MIELIFAIFLLDRNIMNFGDLKSTSPSAADKRFCAQLNLASSFVETREIYTIAENKWKEDEDTLESFYTFWENRDTCIW